MNPQTKLTALDRTIPVVTLLAGGAVAISSLHAMHVDVNGQLTVGGLLSLASALGLAYLVAVSVDSLLWRALKPVRERLLTATQPEPPQYPVAVAEAIEAYLDDLKAGLPLAVEMAGPEGEMPQTGDEWISYRIHPYRLDALTEWHTEHAA
jgi:hypothetical protein